MSNFCAIPLADSRQKAVCIRSTTLLVRYPKSVNQVIKVKSKAYTVAIFFVTFF